jgi:hypothetical protein
MHRDLRRDDSVAKCFPGQMVKLGRATGIATLSQTARGMSLLQEQFDSTLLKAVADRTRLSAGPPP